MEAPAQKRKVLQRSNSAVPNEQQIRMLDYNRAFHFPHQVHQQNANKGPFPTTNYRADFVPHPSQQNQQFRPQDNLKTGTVFFDTTVYQRDFKVQATPEELQQKMAEQRKAQNLFVQHNVRSHVRGLLYTPEDKSRSKSPRPQEELFDKPAKFIMERREVLPQLASEQQTEYTRNFKNLRRDRSVEARLNYDNLRIYPDLKYTPQSAYDQAHTGKQGDPSPARAQYKLNRDANQFTHTINPDQHGIARTEYGQNYIPKAQNVRDNIVRVKGDLPPEMGRPQGNNGYDANWRHV